MNSLKIFELKYLTASSQDEIKNNLIQVYKLYVNPKTAKDPVLQLLADHGETFSQTIVYLMEDIVANLNTYSSQQIFNRINKMLGLIKQMKEDPEKKVRNYVHQIIPATKESERKYREHVKSKLEMVISRLSSVLEKQAKILNKFLPIEVPLEGGEVLPQRKELSKQKIINFLLSPISENYGLSSQDVWEKVHDYPEIKEKLITLINAVDRGHIPIDGMEVKKFVEEIMEIYRERSKNNAPFFELSHERLNKLIKKYGERNENF